jgi:GT2 family glycosyltransferase
MKITTIITNWQRASDTIECVNSVKENHLDNHEILIVDNGSEDNSVSTIQERFPEIKILRLPENIGYTGGYNAGIQYALDNNSDYLFILNNDTKIEKDTISELLKSEWDVAVPKILFDNNPSIIWSAGVKWRFFPPACKMIGYQKRDRKKYQKKKKLKYATGCALLVPRKVIREIGGFDQDFESYMEDYDFSYRVIKAGFSMGYVPTSIVYHKSSQSLGEGSPAKWFLIGRNTIRFYRKNFKFSSCMIFTFVIWVILREIIKGNWKSLNPYLNGIRTGLRSF